MKKGKICVLALAALASLTACGFSGGEADVDRTLPTNDPTSEVTITFWHCLGHAKTSNLEKIINSFNSKYAGKYKVVAEHLGGDYDDLHETLKTKLASGEIPALTMGYPDSFAEYMTKDMSESAILRLDNFINDSSFGYTQAEIDDFVKGYYNEGTGYQFEGTWSLPMYKSTEVMYYNKSYFSGVNDQNLKKFAGNTEFLNKYNLVNSRSSSVGYDADLATDLADLKTWVEAHDGYTYTIPTTWEDMINLGKQMLKDRTDNGLADEFYPIGYDSDANLFITQFAQKGIDFTDAKDENNHFKFKNDAAKVLVADVLKSVQDKVLITKGSLGGKYTNNYFTDVKVAMSIGSTGGSSYQLSSNFEVGLAAVPCRAGCEKKYIQQGPSICLFNNDNDFIHKGAWLFYKELAEPLNNAKLALENSYDPIRISSYNTSAYQEWIGSAGRGVLKYDIPQKTSELKDYYYTSETFVGSGTARTEIGQMIAYTYLNGYSIDQAFDLAYNHCQQKA